VNSTNSSPGSTPWAASAASHISCRAPRAGQTLHKRWRAPTQLSCLGMCELSCLGMCEEGGDMESHYIRTRTCRSCGCSLSQYRGEFHCSQASTQ
jgi:hypothetical protein